MRRAALLGLVLLIGIAVLVVARSPFGYAKQDREAIAQTASRAHLAGTDELGRDRAVRTAMALLLGLAGAAAGAALSTALATGVGMGAAVAPEFLSDALLFLSDLFLSLPWLFLLLIVRSGLPLQTSPMRSATITFLLLGLLGWPACARAVHLGTKAIRNADWMIQGRANGLRGVQLLRRHALPHLLPLLLAQFLLCIPAFLVAEANLGTLGLGVSEPLPSWGTMLGALGSSAALQSTHWVYLPIALLIAVLVLLEALIVEA